jgi:NCS1 family nucleobase:cation symporter-1
LIACFAPQARAKADWPFQLNFFCGFIVSSAVYWALCKISPIPAVSPTGQWCEVRDEDDMRNFSVVYEGEGFDVESAGGSDREDSKRVASGVVDKKAGGDY